MSAGKFSLAWQYPRLIDDGWALLDSQRQDAEEEARRRRGLESARRRVADQLRDAGTRLAPETANRLHKTLRSADGVDAIKGVATEVDQAVAAVRTLEERRRDREIDKTRERLRRSLPRGADAEAPGGILAGRAAADRRAVLGVAGAGPPRLRDELRGWTATKR